MDIRNQRKAALAPDVCSVPAYTFAGAGYVSGADMQRSLIRCIPIQFLGDHRQIHICPLPVADGYPQPAESRAGAGYVFVADS
jgi:hypothetical protein